MSWQKRVAALDKRALSWSLVVAMAAFTLLSIFVDRLIKIPTAQALVGTERWEAPIGRELRLKGVGGRIFGFETAGGGGLSLEAGPVRLENGARVRSLVLLASGGAADSNSDNRAGLQISTADPAASAAVALRRQAHRLPKLEIRALDAPLRVETRVVIGDALVMPTVTVRADGRNVDPPGFGFAFTLLPEGRMSLTMPPAGGGDWSAVSLDVGSAAEDETRLSLSEMVLANQNDDKPWWAACGARSGSHAFRPFFRWLSSPVPTGRDCSSGHLNATGLQLTTDRLAIELSGSAFIFREGRPRASPWSTFMANPVIATAVNTLIPLAVTTVLGWVTYRKTSRPPVRRKKRRRRAQGSPAG